MKIQVTEKLAQSDIPRHASFAGNEFDQTKALVFVPVKTVIVLSENEDNRSMFIPDLGVQCRHNTYSELEGHNKDVYDTRFFRTVVLTGAIVMRLLIKFEKRAVLGPLWRIFTHHFTENIKPSLPNSCNLVSPWQSCFGSAARRPHQGSRQTSLLRFG